MVLMDEFNLAAPEYYFSQLLQVLPRMAGATTAAPAGRDGPAKKPAPAAPASSSAGQENESRVLRLYDPAGHGTADAATHQIVLHPNVVFWGTINYDETTERLSPRLLDRTGMVFLTARGSAAR